MCVYLVTVENSFSILLFYKGSTVEVTVAHAVSFVYRADASVSHTEVETCILWLLVTFTIKKQTNITRLEGDAAFDIQTVQ